MRLSRLIADKYNISRRAAKELILSGKVKINNKTVKKDVEADEADYLEACIEKKIIEYDLNDFFIKENNDTLFLYKPPFMHSERLRPEDELAISDIMSDKYSDYNLLSRLDYEADGILGAVKNDIIEVKTTKKYYAFVYGDFPDYFELDNVIDAHKRKAVKVTPEKGGNKTIFTLIKNYGKFSLVEAELEKAARHQVRAFLASLAFPIIGDKLYGGMPFERLMLHCHTYRINNETEYSGREDSFVDFLTNRIKI